jgi:hypothetical protein
MKSNLEQVGNAASWPPALGEAISFHSGGTLKSGVLQRVRWGLVWRDFILDDGRVIPEHKVVGCPEPPAWRIAEEVTAEERQACEHRLASMADAGLDPRERDQCFWAELNQYLAYTYLRFKPTGRIPIQR